MEEGAEELGGAGVGGWGRKGEEEGGGGGGRRRRVGEEGGGGGWWRREEEEGGGWGSLSFQGERRGSGRHQSNIKEAHQKTD